MSLLSEAAPEQTSGSTNPSAPVAHTLTQGSNGGRVHSENGAGVGIADILTTAAAARRSPVRGL